MPLSRRTIVRLAEGISEAFTHAGLDGLFYEFDVQASDPGTMSNKLKRSVALVRGIESKLPPEQAQDVFLELANNVLSNPYQRQQLVRLTASLSVDGLEWGEDRLVPTDPGAAPLAPEVTALEQELKGLGFDVAATHYRQAVDNFTDGNFEASNGQLRSFLEALIPAAAQRRGQPQAASPQGALDYLKNEKVLDPEEWAILRALWNGSQDNGPHAGLTVPAEARFRLHFATAAGRYLVEKVRN